MLTQPEQRARVPQLVLVFRLKSFLKLLVGQVNTFFINSTEDDWSQTLVKKCLMGF